MQTLRGPTLVIAVALVATTWTVAAAPPEQSNFVAPLSGDEEVPSVETDARGLARFQLASDGASIGYRLTVANIDNVTQSHIHMAPEGVNGPVVAFLFGPSAGDGRVDGVLATGNITADDLVGPLAGQPLSALLDAMRAGNTYVNVHTLAHPAGEVRGRIG